jgi:hypothetical protein
MQSKKCSKCGTLFTCHSPQPGCWCEKMQLSIDTLDQLKNNFQDCLCSQCLKSFENVESPEATLSSHYN